jgi:predicted ATPase
LFVARARAVAPAFTVDDTNAAAIVGIVRRLEGLPLAIELAAARVKLLPPANILARLDASLDLLVGGRRDLADRQQTLRGTIAWSYDLLGDSARRMIAVLAVFRAEPGWRIWSRSARRQSSSAMTCWTYCKNW